MKIPLHFLGRGIRQRQHELIAADAGRADGIGKQGPEFDRSLLQYIVAAEMAEAIVDLFEIALKKQCRIDVRDYTRKKDGISIWDRSKLNGTKVGQVLDGNYAEGLRSGPVYSDHIRLLIAEYSQDAQMKKLADELRDVEKAIRNRAAHEIVSITDEKIKELTGFTGKQIMDKLIRFFVYTGMGITADSWKSYDRLNQKILSAMM